MIVLQRVQESGRVLCVHVLSRGVLGQIYASQRPRTVASAGECSVLASGEVSHDRERGEYFWKLGSCQKGSKSALILVTLTDRQVREGFVDGEHVTRSVVRGLFWGLQGVVCDDVVPRVNTLPCLSASGKLRQAKTC